MPGSTGLRYPWRTFRSLERLCLMAVSGPFSRTHEAARVTRAAMSGYGAPQEARPEPASVAHSPLRMPAGTTEDRPGRRQTRRSRWPWLVTVVVMVVFVEVLWYAYEEVNRLRSAGLVAQEKLTPVATTPPPKPLLKPLETLMAEVVGPPRPRLKPR